ncbi:MAG: hypothetical protein ACLTCI_09615 [[Clostridium] nexile]
MIEALRENDNNMIFQIRFFRLSCADVSGRKALPHETIVGIAGKFLGIGRHYLRWQRWQREQ